MDLSEQDIKQFLQNICEDYIILNFVYESREKFNLSVCLKLSDDFDSDYDKFCRDWVQSFSKFTLTNWIVRYTYPKIKKLIYKKSFVCQHSEHNKCATESKSRKRGRMCKANITFRVKIINRNTIRNDENLRKGLNVYINVFFEHSHLIEVAENLRYLRCDPEIELQFVDYFESGMSAAAAKTHHEMKIADKYLENKNIYLANGHINPTENHIKYMHQKWVAKKCGDRSGKNIVDLISERKVELEKNGYLVILTEIMRRAFLAELADEIVFVDTTSLCDQTSTNITFIFCTQKIGAIPIACVLHTAQTEANYTLAFSAVKEAIENNELKKKFEPTVIMTDDCAAERKSLSSVFPSSCLLLCPFQVSQAFWRWLCDANHNIDMKKRQEVMLMFRNMIYAETVSENKKQFDNMCKNEYIMENIQIKCYINTLWQRRNEWCMTYRNNFITHGHNINIYTEGSFRILKDIVLERCKDLHEYALIDFISNTLENYHYHRLLSFADIKECLLSLHSDFAKEEEHQNVYRVNSNEFNVTSSIDDQIMYTINIKVAFCDCEFGRNGTFCKHLNAVEKNYGFIFENSPILSENDRTVFAKIALGTEIDEHFYKGIVKDELVEPDDVDIEVQASDPMTDEMTPCENDFEVSENKIFDEEFLNQYQSSLSNLKTEFNKLFEKYENCPTTDGLMAINNLTHHLKNINTS